MKDAPGSKYYDSIFNNYRVYAGLIFYQVRHVKIFKKIINTKKYPLNFKT